MQSTTRALKRRGVIMFRRKHNNRKRTRGRKVFYIPVKKILAVEETVKLKEIRVTELSKFFKKLSEIKETLKEGKEVHSFPTIDSTIKLFKLAKKLKMVKLNSFIPGNFKAPNLKKVTGNINDNIINTVKDVFSGNTGLSRLQNSSVVSAIT